MAGLMCKTEKLEYNIYRYSCYSSNCLPENILEDCPTNQKTPQFLTLKLLRPAIVKTIKFGKYEKSHVCNLRKFQIFGGLDDDNMELLLEGTLSNDTAAETFELRHTFDTGKKFPILYLKIIPVSHGTRFVFSVWRIELFGQDDPMYLGANIKNYSKLQETEIVKLCLKHFRQQGYDETFKILQKQTKIDLEHPIITDLHQCLVYEGDFSRSEKIIEDCIDQGLMDDYLMEEDYKHKWELQETKSAQSPGTRGGHQLVIDTKRQLIYLFGGWDGFCDLSDLWCFNIENKSWSLLYESSELHGGPTPRSCHKMVFDSISGNIYVLGRYLDNSIRKAEYIKSEFFMYDTEKNIWVKICNDTSQVGGPKLVYDHQMCIDVAKRTIYVFGGKILTPRTVNQLYYCTQEYSGLFSYHITTNKWQQLLVDSYHPSASKLKISSITSRITHCMVFHDKNRKLYIYGGQREKEEIDDFISYDVDTNCIDVISVDKDNINNNNNNNIGCNTNKNNNLQYRNPPIGFTQRATIDCDRDEIYIFSSLNKQKDKRDTKQDDSTSNSFWVFSLRTNKWTQIYNSKHPSQECSLLDPRKKIPKDTLLIEPCPRYAHQMVYDDIRKIHYLFGGNPGTFPQLRLDDFWILLLHRPTRYEILRHCQYLVRKLHYKELIRTNPSEAIRYLQNHISEVIDHSNPVQVKKFQMLSFLLFKPEESDCNESNQQLQEDIEIDNDIDSTNCNFQEDMSSNNYQKAKDEDEAMATNMITTQHKLDNNKNNLMPLFDNKIYNLYKKCSGKKNFQDYYFDMKSRRMYLFNKIVELMPVNMVQPKRNLSDFVFM